MRPPRTRLKSRRPLTLIAAAVDRTILVLGELSESGSGELCHVDVEGGELIRKALAIGPTMRASPLRAVRVTGLVDAQPATTAMPGARVNVAPVDLQRSIYVSCAVLVEAQIDVGELDLAPHFFPPFLKFGETASRNSGRPSSRVARDC
jgi:hypothetical protein